MITASPAYWGCPRCGHGDALILVDGGFMCADWPDCGASFATLDDWIAGRKS
jgi:hypothetical protein